LLYINLEFIFLSWFLAREPVWFVAKQEQYLVLLSFINLGLICLSLLLVLDRVDAVLLQS